MAAGTQGDNNETPVLRNILFFTEQEQLRSLTAVFMSLSGVDKLSSSTNLYQLGELMNLNDKETKGLIAELIASFEGALGILAASVARNGDADKLSAALK